MRKLIATGWILCLFVGVTTTGCTTTIDADKSKLGPRPVGCNVGPPAQTNPCTCPGGVARVQVCNGYGRYNPCPCDGVAGIGG